MKVIPGQKVVSADGRAFIARSFTEARGYKTWWVTSPQDFAPEALSGFDVAGEQPPEGFPEAEEWLFLIPEGAEPLPADAPPPSRPVTPEPRPAPAPAGNPGLEKLVLAYVRSVYLFGATSEDAVQAFVLLASEVLS